MTSEVTEIPAMPDLSEEVSEELALLEEATEAEENQLSEMTAEQGLIEDLDELAPLDEIGELEELSPLEQIEQLDEFSSDIDTLLPSDDDELGGLDTGLSEEEGEQVGEVSSSILMIGNGILVLLIGIAFFIWRRKSGASKNPGEQL